MGLLLWLVLPVLTPIRSVSQESVRLSLHCPKRLFSNTVFLPVCVYHVGVGCVVRVCVCVCVCQNQTSNLLIPRNSFFQNLNNNKSQNQLRHSNSFFRNHKKKQPQPILNISVFGNYTNQSQPIIAYQCLPKRLRKL